MAFEEHARTQAGGGGGKDVAAMHDFIRKQATNQEADYSVRPGVFFFLGGCVCVCLCVAVGG